MKRKASTPQLLGGLRHASLVLDTLGAAGGSQRGTTDTKVLRWVGTPAITGTGISVTTTAANGTIINLNQGGLYAVGLYGYTGGAGAPGAWRFALNYGDDANYNTAIDLTSVALINGIMGQTDAAQTEPIHFFNGGCFIAQDRSNPAGANLRVYADTGAGVGDPVGVNVDMRLRIDRISAATNPGSQPSSIANMVPSSYKIANLTATPNGTTDTNVLRFDTASAADIVGNAITLLDSAANGSRFQITQRGIYVVSLGLIGQVSQNYTYGISKNATTLTGAVANSQSGVLAAMRAVNPIGHYCPMHMSCIVPVTSEDVANGCFIRAHCTNNAGAAPTLTDNDMDAISIVRLNDLAA